MRPEERMREYLADQYDRFEERDEDAERYRDLGRASWPTGADDAS